MKTDDLVETFVVLGEFLVQINIAEPVVSHEVDGLRVTQINLLVILKYNRVL
jgi:hypothetical protein